MKSGRDGRKKLGAAVAAFAVCVFLLLVLGAIVFAVWGGAGLNPLLVIYGLIVVCAIAGTLIVLMLRFKEINTGEEDEARQY